MILYVIPPDNPDQKSEPTPQATVESDAESVEVLAIDEVGSDEPDDSADEDWSSGDESIEYEKEEALTGESAGSEAEVEEDINNSLFGFDVQQSYVPDEFQEDSRFAAPSVAEEDDAEAAKQARREHRAATAKAAKQNSDRRAASANEAREATEKRKTA
ncbi:unnamed protein product [Phytophthora fragariaefolia]|uniref:Unnamed protein product n=1 Tax=Phytophthora fragariaefolia TaxID=1490495 RepID=A0A9W7CQP4_9STRA|nr:unnamed protein product [Phytophthora fragariaefolia]